MRTRAAGCWGAQLHKWKQALRLAAAEKHTNGACESVSESMRGGKGKEGGGDGGGGEGLCGTMCMYIHAPTPRSNPKAGYTYCEPQVQASCPNGSIAGAAAVLP